MYSGKIFLLFFAVHLSFFACSKRVNSRNPAESRQFYRQGYEPVSVVDGRDIAGCGFLLLRLDSSLYRPVNLSAEWQKPGKRIWVKVETIKSNVSVCMRGQAVKIIELKPDNR